ncbi:MAG: DNA-directed RNA polymerase, partial [Ferrovibrionaceae bacterium]
SAVAPNVIHSLDASHLMLTVLAASESGIRDYALIHDSFGTHAGHCSRWSALIRQAFVDLYLAYDPCAAIREAAWAALLPAGRDALPPLPERGSLDLAAVLGADYAFA